MSKKRFTQWFGPDLNPKIPGVYQRDYADKEGRMGVQFAYWNGKYWGIFGWNENDAVNMAAIRSAHNLKWRGLAEKP